MNMQMQQTLKLIAQYTLPAPLHRFFAKQLLRDKYRPPVEAINFGSLRRIIPVSIRFGYNRGLPINRYYIENFLLSSSNDVKGRVLEIGDRSYTQKFGGKSVTHSDVLHVCEGNPEATIVGDLVSCEHVPSNAFDCLILTQTIHLIYEVRSAIQTIKRILKPGGVALITVPGISQIAYDEWGDYWCWSFTALSARRMFEEFFPSENVQVNVHGNVLAATAFLQGLATEELQKEELDYCDPHYQVIITIRVVKPEID